MRTASDLFMRGGSLMWNNYRNLKGRFIHRSRWYLPLVTDFTVVRQLIGTRSPIRNTGFTVASQLSGTRSPERKSDFMCQPHDKHIAHLLFTVYTAFRKYAISLEKFNLNLRFLNDGFKNVFRFDRLESCHMRCFQVLFSDVQQWAIPQPEGWCQD